MKRRDFLALAAGSSAALAWPGHAQGAPVRQPNIVYVFSDEHRWQSMSISELPELHTPNMARMAAEGLEFTRCISNYPVCSPHRGILLTGQWPHQQGVIDNSIPLDAERDTVGKAFKRAGYQTAYIGKWHLGGVRAEPFGFDHSLIWTDLHQNVGGGKYHPAEAEPVQPPGYNATHMTDQAIEYMEAHADSTNPFFLMLSLHPPHANFLDAPAPYQDRYPEGSLPWRPNAVLPEAGGDEAGNQIWNQNSWPYYKGYHAHITGVDAELGRLIEYLDQRGLSENTLLIYSSDHGSMMGSHGLGSKRQPYEESIRVPFLVRQPGRVPAGKKVDALFGTIDIVPTLCAAAGLEAPAECSGQDFSPWFWGGHGPQPDAQFIMHISKKNASGGDNHPAPIFRGVRSERHTYAVYPDRPWCLFDLEADPYQENNLIAAPGTAELRQALHARLAGFLEAAADPFELPAV